MSKIGKVTIDMPRDHDLVLLTNIPDGCFFLYQNFLHIATETGWIKLPTGRENKELDRTTKVIPVNVTIDVSFV